MHGQLLLGAVGRDLSCKKLWNEEFVSLSGQQLLKLCTIALQNLERCLPAHCAFYYRLRGREAFAAPSSGAQMVQQTFMQ